MNAMHGSLLARRTLAGDLGGEPAQAKHADIVSVVPVTTKNGKGLLSGITIEKAAGMFPEGVTGLPEIDAYLMLWNPFGLKVAPRVYSPDLPVARQVR